MSSKENNQKGFNRGTGLLIIEVRHSNPNGDPDTESDPRMIDGDGRGLISPVSFKRKLRDLIIDKEGLAYELAEKTLDLKSDNNKRSFDILEKRGRERNSISAMTADTFTNTFWDARLFGNTFLEEMKETEIKVKDKDKDKEHFITTGVVQFGPGISIAPIEVERLTMTNKSGVEQGKDRGMAPLGWRVVQHAVYAMPFFVNPMMAKKSGCDQQDINLMKFLIPHAYRNTASAIRPFVEIVHAWYAEHKTPLGSCPDSLILDSLMPHKTKGESEEPSKSIADYSIPHKGSIPKEVMNRLVDVTDLCA